MTAQRPSPKTPAPAKKTTDAASANRQIDALIARLDDWRGAQLAEVRALIRAADPQVEEQWKWMGTPTFAHNGIYAIVPHPTRQLPLRVRLWVDHLRERYGDPGFWRRPG